MERVGKAVELPPFDTDEDAGEHGVEFTNADLAGFLIDIGPTVNNGMGNSPITHTCLRDWMSNTHWHLGPWDCEALMTASRAYAGAVSEYSDKMVPAPWGGDIAAQRRKVNEQIRAGFAGLMARKKG